MAYSKRTLVLAPCRLLPRHATVKNLLSRMDKDLGRTSVVLHDTGTMTCGHRRPLAFRRLTAILAPLSEDAIALTAACGQ